LAFLTLELRHDFSNSHAVFRADFRSGTR